MDKLEKGRLGEDAVCTLLEQRGHEIIARNYHRRCGEIDIISKCGRFVVFTEVNNSPDPQLRSLMCAKWKTMWSCENNQDVGLEAAIH